MNQNNGAAAPSQRICAYEYTVKRGDSFYLISKRLGVALRDLMAANPDMNPARLMVGDVLCIPLEEPGQHLPQTSVKAPAQVESTQETPEETPPEEAPAEEAPAEEAPAEEAPTLFTCPLEQRRTVQPGQTVSDFQLTAGLNRHTMDLANPNVDLDNLVPGQVLCVPDMNQACPLPSSYILHAHDTLETVAAKFNLSIGALLRANPCLAPADFLPCVCVHLPSQLPQ